MRTHTDIYDPLKESEVLAIAAKAVRLYAESHPRPVSVNQKQAAGMLNVSKPTVCRMVKTGRVKLNSLGQIPISEIDRLLASS